MITRAITLKWFTVCTALAFLLLSANTNAQIFKKKKKEDDKEPGYAYQTYSTTQPKEKRKGFAGGEAKFNFEKPVLSVPYEKNDRVFDYSKAPFFGHKRPPRRTGSGVMRLCKVCGIKHH